MIAPGFTFLSPTPSYDTEHLYVVIAVIDASEVLFVNITSKKQNSDRSCELTKGDHPFITHESVINYADAKKAQINMLESAIKNNIMKSHQPVSPELLGRILNGALESPLFPEGMKKYIRL